MIVSMPRWLNDIRVILLIGVVVFFALFPWAVRGVIWLVDVYEFYANFACGCR